MTTENAGAGPREIDRRRFLKQATGTAAIITLFGIGVPGLLKGPAFPTIAEAGGVVFPDPSLCIGCLTCEVACSEVHRAAGRSDVPRIRIYNDARIRVADEIVTHYGRRGAFRQQPCVQCPDAPCLPVCPVDALQVEPKTGARYIKEDVCVACGKCEQACIFPTFPESMSTNSINFHQISRITYDPKRNVYAKCDLCYFLEAGPACVARCPVNIRIREGIVKSDVLCLDLPPSTKANFERMRSQQSVQPPATGGA